MKKIILSVAVATMALSTVASALEDIKVSGQAKLWYETSDTLGTTVGTVNEKTGNLFDTEQSAGEVVFKLGMTGKQGNVGAGVTIYQSSTMGLEGVVVGASRSGAPSVVSPNSTVNGSPYLGEAYITAPLIASTILKFGKQELNTPLAFTETWNAAPNTFNAAVLVNNSVDNLTLIGAYVGQGNGQGSFGTNGIDGSFSNSQFFGTAYAVAGLYKSDAFAANLWAYQINNVGGALTLGGNGGTALYTGGDSVNAVWADASVKAGVVNVTGTAAVVTTDSDAPTGANVNHIGDTTSAFALSADTKVSEVTLFAAASTVSEGQVGVANTATGGKKSKLPTEAVYTDGLYVAQPGSTAFKLKASGKLGTTGLALQGVMNTNSDDDRYATPTTDNTRNTTEVDLIISQKLGDFDLKGILMNRSFEDSTMDDQQGGNYVRVIASVNF
jgi:imipenem/basic amino acid-specific outer membrane pore